MRCQRSFKSNRIGSKCELKVNKFSQGFWKAKPTERRNCEILRKTINSAQIKPAKICVAT